MASSSPDVTIQLRAVEGRGPIPVQRMHVNLRAHRANRLSPNDTEDACKVDIETRIQLPQAKQYAQSHIRTRIPRQLALRFTCMRATGLSVPCTGCTGINQLRKDVNSYDGREDIHASSGGGEPAVV